MSTKVILPVTGALLPSLGTAVTSTGPACSASRSAASWRSGRVKLTVTGEICATVTIGVAVAGVTSEPGKTLITPVRPPIVARMVP
ncbi:hypothetical protein D3C72_1738990 [compost metagenome]